MDPAVRHRIMGSFVVIFSKCCSQKAPSFVSWSSTRATNAAKKKLVLLFFAHEHIFIAWCLFKHLWNYSAECLGCKKEKQQKQEGKHWNVYINKHYPEKNGFLLKKDFHLRSETAKRDFPKNNKKKIYIHARNDFSFIGFSFIAFCALVSRKLFCFPLSKICIYNLFVLRSFPSPNAKRGEISKWEQFNGDVDVTNNQEST